jgi:hypothetical protein
VIAQILMDVQPIEVDGKWWVEISMNGRKLKRRGPFKDANTAKIEADRVVRYWQPALPTSASKDVVELHGKPIELTSDEGRRFVIDCTRAGEGLITDETLREIYEISPENWAQIDKNTALIKAIRDERKRRIRNGVAARESACELYAKVPAVMGTIMNDTKSPARHRIEAAKEIRQQAVGGDGAESIAEASERFIININMGADVAPLKIDVPPEDIRRNTKKQIEGEIDAGE